MVEIDSIYKGKFEIINTEDLQMGDSISILCNDGDWVDGVVLDSGTRLFGASNYISLMIFYMDDYHDGEGEIISSNKWDVNLSDIKKIRRFASLSKGKF